MEDGVYKVRFMPGFAQPYHFEISQAVFQMKFIPETFDVDPAGENNHGLVRWPPGAGWLTRTVLYISLWDNLLCMAPAGGNCTEGYHRNTGEQPV